MYNILIYYVILLFFGARASGDYCNCQRFESRQYHKNLREVNTIYVFKF
jgi:hypothetical protein